ncbi:helix-turn-helix domain-containing protein [Nonomuraea rhizosphaerae]|uniref:helix-turn-helix domain-containing protein n=1 Tax=Nonomuraea rhizosphaerae TaxID=2665663 RepID=UPI001C5D1C6C|nr:helix-turn-helix domain-containing protein [Nonomuraea rhizosphaerae]
MGSADARSPSPSEPGGVTVPAGLERDVLVTLLRGLNREMRENGGTPRPGMTEFLRALQAADQPAPVADVGPPEHAPATVERVMVTVGQVAEQTGYSPRQLRRLAAAGRIRAQRLHARAWLIDPTSFKTYRQGASS